MSFFTIELLEKSFANCKYYLFAGLAKRVGATVLIASTSEVYGDPEVHPQSETYWGHVNPIGTFNYCLKWFY